MQTVIDESDSKSHCSLLMNWYFITTIFSRPHTGSMAGLTIEWMLGTTRTHHSQPFFRIGMTRQSIFQGFYYHLLKVIFGSHSINLRNDKLNKKQTDFYKQTNSTICKISNKDDSPYRSSNKRYSYQVFYSLPVAWT